MLFWYTKILVSLSGVVGGGENPVYPLDMHPLTPLDIPRGVVGGTTLRPPLET